MNKKLQKHVQTRHCKKQATQCYHPGPVSVANMKIYHKISWGLVKSRDWYLKSADRCDIWQTFPQICCRRKLKRHDCINYQSRGFVYWNRHWDSRALLSPIRCGVVWIRQELWISWNYAQRTQLNYVGFHGLRSLHFKWKNKGNV